MCVCLHGVWCVYLYSGVWSTYTVWCVQLCSVWRVVYIATVHVCMLCMLLLHMHTIEVYGVCTQLLGVWSVHIYSAYVCKVCICAVWCVRLCGVWCIHRPGMTFLSVCRVGGMGASVRCVSVCGACALVGTLEDRFLPQLAEGREWDFGSSVRQGRLRKRRAAILSRAMRSSPASRGPPGLGR
jgi:hypothetical protein